LIEHHLKRVGEDPSGWNILYRDPSDGRYWELIFPHSELQGGGPPTLCQISQEDRVRYGM
jgi:hypothetical protein